jgi:serine/threonine protein kinase
MSRSVALEIESVESFCNLLARSKLVPADEVHTLRQRWLHEMGESASDPAKFRKWLVTQRYLTAYQAALLSRGRVERFFLGDYKLLDRIGVGGMAGVYKAIHRLGQTVAIKVLPPSKAKDAKKFARFQREGRLAVRLQHPNVVRTFQIAEDNGLHYLVMEYLEGETLEEVVKRRGQLPLDEAVRLIHQALLGLDYLHQEGIVHRDLKPANLMLVPPLYPSPFWGEKTRGDTTLNAIVKILDIGLGRALFDEADAPAGDDSNLTTEGAIFGTPDYMSPEQSRDTHSVDVRSDIYSLGCTLFYALAGQPPFPDTSLVRKVIRHATDPVPSLKLVNPAVSDGLQQIINRMMAKDAAQRYPTPRDAAQALQDFLGTEKDSPLLETSEVKQDFLDWLRESTGGEEAAPPRPLPVSVAPSVVDAVLLDTAKKKSPWARLSRRDALMLSVGAAILVVMGGIIWLLKHLLGNMRKTDESHEDDKSDPTR